MYKARNFLQDAFQKATIDISLYRLEKKSGLTGLREAFYQSLANDSNDVILSTASNGNKSTQLLVRSYKSEGTWFSGPSYSIDLRAENFEDGECTAGTLHHIIMRNHPVSGFQRSVTGKMYSAEGEVYPYAAENDDIRAYHRLIFKP